MCDVQVVCLASVTVAVMIDSVWCAGCVPCECNGRGDDRQCVVCRLCHGDDRQCVVCKLCALRV